jgi:hypothetical protein
MQKKSSIIASQGGKEASKIMKSNWIGKQNEHIYIEKLITNKGMSIAEVQLQAEIINMMTDCSFIINQKEKKITRSNAQSRILKRK